VEYLGHWICPKGVKVDVCKIAAMQSWPCPKNIIQLQGFLGLTGYYRKFVQHYGIIAKTLMQLLKKGNFLWTDEADQAFTVLKQAMTCILVLAMPNFSQPFEVHIDASNIGIGAVMVQQDRPMVQSWYSKTDPWPTLVRPLGQRKCYGPHMPKRC